MSTRRSTRLSNQSKDVEINGTNVEAPVASKLAGNGKKAKKFKSDPDASTVMPPPVKAVRGKRKASVTATESQERDEIKTPKKRARAAKSPPPSTPTPSAAKAMAEPAVTPKKTSRPRQANPLATNAPLQTPGGSRVVKAYPSDLFEMTPNTAAKSDVTTTDNLLKTACDHLCSVDPRLKAAIDKHHCSVFSPEGLQEEINPFSSLCSSIISQQVSGAAAASIKRKFIGLFPEPAKPNPRHFPTPAQILEKDIETLRTAGLSQRKAEYITGLSEKFVSGELSSQMLIDASDEELLEKLIAVRGLGRWSVEMFACFSLKRMDIFSTGDLGVQRGMAAYIGKDVSKLKAKGGGKWKYMSEQDMLDIASKFVPYRSLFMWYMWRMEDVNLDALS
ncbi:DNA glycosylase [Microthyrium microscopicum]|uniref:DNA glycosylase n=1 Tax=Microthyrium microscopicum TaxID=703497 RepID=A0A6A6TVK7_9PEZI|nr:DNA glycosylase [Microthyrium microscopicum]